MKYVSRKNSKNKKEHANRFVSLFLTMFMILVMLSVGTNTYAAEIQQDGTLALNAGEFLGYLKYGESMYTYPVYIWDGAEEQIAYCFNAHKAWPSPTENIKWGFYSLYEEEHFILSGNEEIMKVIYNGYPYNKSDIQSEFSLTDMQFRAVTQAAVWKYTDKIAINEAIGKLTAQDKFKWTDDMSKAYNRLVISNSQLLNPPENFSLKLYTTTNDYEYLPVQQLLSTNLSIDDAKPQPMPIYTTTFTIEAEKFMDGNIPSVNQTFNFELLNENGDIIDKAVNKGSSITFNPITYASEGIYTYFIREAEDSNGNINYDKSVYEVQVDVSNDGNGILSSDVTYYDFNGDRISKPVFENTTKAEEYSLSISKNVTGVYGDKDKMFDFEIILKDKAGSPISKDFAAEINSIDGISETEHKSIALENGEAVVSLKHGQSITITGIPKGSSYIVREIDADDYETVINGVISDNKTVSGSDINDDIKLEVINSRNDIKFESIPVKFEVEKLLEIAGGKPSNDEEFTFVLNADDESYPMPEINTVSIIGEGKTSFNEIVYTMPGIYTYTVTERTENIEGYTFDETVYHVTVSVVAEKDGDVFRLSPTILTVKDGSDENTDIIFVNRYSKPEQPTQPEPENPAPDTEETKPQPEPENPAPDTEETKPQPEPENPAPDTEDSKPQPEPENPTPDTEESKPQPEPENPAPDTEDTKPQPEPENPTPDTEDSKPQPEPENPAPDTEDSKPQPEPENPAPDTEDTKPQPEPENPTPDTEDTKPQPEPENEKDDKDNTILEDNEKEEYDKLPQTGNIWSDEMMILSGLVILMLGVYIIKEIKHE